MDEIHGAVQDEINIKLYNFYNDHLICKIKSLNDVFMIFL